MFIIFNPYSIKKNLISKELLSSFFHPQQRVIVENINLIWYLYKQQQQRKAFKPLDLCSKRATQAENWFSTRPSVPRPAWFALLQSALKRAFYLRGECEKVSCLFFSVILLLFLFLETNATHVLHKFSFGTHFRSDNDKFLVFDRLCNFFFQFRGINGFYE